MRSATSFALLRDALVNVESPAATTGAADLPARASTAATLEGPSAPCRHDFVTAVGCTEKASSLALSSRTANMPSMLLAGVITEKR